MLNFLIIMFMTMTSTWGFADTFYLGGIQVNEPDHGKWISALKREGMNTIEVTVYAHQGDWDTDQLVFDAEDPGLESEVRAAKAQGMKVVLILRTALDHAYPKNKFLWHGLIMPRSEEAIVSWFKKYSTFAMHWARFAQKKGIDVLGIASELNSLTSTVPVVKIPELQEWYLDRLKQRKIKGRLLEHDDVISERHLWVRGYDNYSTFKTYLDDKQMAHEQWAKQTAYFDHPDPVERINERRRNLDRLWRDLIRDIRRIYHGQLTCGANFDQYRQMGFWDAMDVMGINAYFPLRDRLLETSAGDRLERRLDQGWKTVFNGIDAFIGDRKLKNIPILFTELGYTRRRNCTIEPWADTGFSMIGPASHKKLVIWQDQPEDYPERAMAVRALYEITRHRQRNPLIGLLYWKLSTLEAHRDIEPFACILGGHPEDPLVESLRLFR